MSIRRNTQVRLKGSVLKTDRGVKARGGSNPSSSAILILNLMKLEHILEIVLSAAFDAADFLYAKKRFSLLGKIALLFLFLSVFIDHVTDFFDQRFQ